MENKLLKKSGKNEGLKEEWKDYYLYLEDLRKSGKTNMFGAVPYLQAQFKLEKAVAKDVLLNWMNNYTEIAKKYYNEENK